MQNRYDVLNAALSRVDFRAEEYGTPEDNFERIARLWSAYMHEPFTAKQVAMMLLLMKVAREEAAGSFDTLVDIAGYAACAVEVK